MRKLHAIVLAIAAVLSSAAISTSVNEVDPYRALYEARVVHFRQQQQHLLDAIRSEDLSTPDGRALVKDLISDARRSMKAADIWLRYFGPLPYKSINAPLPVEWETEVFEKFEKPYKRVGAGLTLAELALDQEDVDRAYLEGSIHTSIIATDSFLMAPITEQLNTPDAFFFSNRLYLLNLAALYTTGFECPDTARVIPELRAMVGSVRAIYDAFNARFPDTPLPDAYLERYEAMVAFVRTQPDAYSAFDHWRFLSEFVDPLFALQQQAIADHHVSSRSFLDYTLSSSSRSLFNKDLYTGQDTKGVFRRVQDTATLQDLARVGRSLFNDPILSGNNERSCASCHRPDHLFNDTVAGAERFDHRGRLPRNTPSLVNADFNHLLMADGKHTTLQAQAHAVIGSPDEMGANEQDVLRKVLSCPDYRTALQRLARATPHAPVVTMEHLVSALTFYYGRFSQARSPFDEAMTGERPVDASVKRGFNLFMSKAQCATCHFVPLFNGVKPPYVGSEFEVLGVPEDPAFAALSDDEGRFVVNPAEETAHAFRTGSLRNIGHTAPYMHNGVFATLDEVIDLYDRGGGAGRGLPVENQTLSSEPLHLTASEKGDLLLFLASLDEHVVPDSVPSVLPRSKHRSLNGRRPGGIY